MKRLLIAALVCALPVMAFAGGISESSKQITKLGGPVPEYDDVTRAAVGMTVPHHQIHKGGAFRCGGWWNGSIGTGGFANIMIQTGEKDAHLLYDLSADAAFHVWLYEHPTVVTNGTALGSANKNRQSSQLATLSAFQNTGASAFGNAVPGIPIFVPGGRGPQSSGASAPGVRNEWILKRNAKYFIHAINKSGAASKTLVIELDWYEEN